MIALRIRRWSGSAVVLALLLEANAASAQEGFGMGLMPQPAAQPSTGSPQMVATPESGQSNEAPGSVKLFDGKRSTVSYGIELGPLWSRRAEGSRTNFRHAAPLAGEIAIASAFTTPRLPFLLVGSPKMLFRIIDDKSFSWAVLHEELGGGLRIGPLEPEARIRLGLLVADVIHAKTSVQLFSPGVSAGLGLHLGSLRFELKGNSDYLWRWFGPDYMVRSVTFGLRLDIPRPKNPFPGSPS